MIDRIRNAERVTATYSSDRRAAALATAEWLSTRGIVAPPGFRWDVAIALDVVGERAPASFDGRTDTRFHLSITANEWGFFFCHQGRVSWIRVTDNASVYDRDEFKLLRDAPPLRDLGRFLRTLEGKHAIRFRRDLASVRTNLVDALEPIADWLADL